MDYDLRQLERMYSSGQVPQAVILQARSRAQQHLRKSFPISSNLENSYLFVLAPLDFGVMTHDVRNYDNMQNYYQSLIDLISKFPGRIVVYHYSNWRSIALHHIYNQYLTSLNHELDTYLSDVASSYPNKLKVVEIMPRAEDDTDDLILEEIVETDLHPLAGVFFTSGRLDRVVRTTRVFNNNIRSLPELQQVPRFLIWDLAYAFTKEGTVYYPLNNPETHKLSSISGVVYGSDALYPSLDRFLAEVANRSGVVNLHSSTFLEPQSSRRKH